MMQTDVKGATCAANGSTTAFNGRTRLKGLWYSATGASTIAVKDNATTLFTLTIGAAGALWVIFRGDPAALLRLEVGRGEVISLALPYECSGCGAERGRTVHASWLTPAVRSISVAVTISASG